MMRVVQKFAFFIFLISALAACGGNTPASQNQAPTANAGGGGGDTPASQNQAPTANAGSDQVVITGTIVNLDASASTDPDSDALSYQWALTSSPSGSASALSDGSIVNPSFTPDVSGDYVISLVVSDGTATSSADTVTITAEQQLPPVANAGTDRVVETGTQVSLDGSASADPNGETISYHWAVVSVPGGSGVISLAASTMVNPVFTPDVDGVYVFSLVVNDGTSDSISDTVSITADKAPVVLGIEPAVISNLINHTVRVSASNMDTAASDVTLTDSSGNSVHPNFVTHSDSNDVIDIEVPAALAADNWDVSITNINGQVGVLPASLSISDTLTISISSVDPWVVDNLSRYELVLNSGGGFAAGSRVYLASGASTTELQTSYMNSFTLRATVPAGMSAGSYDVVAVAPSGAVGLKTGLTVTANAMPKVTKLVPASFIAGSGPYTFTLTGTDFDATVGSNVLADCSDGSPVNASVLSTTSTTIQGTLDLSSTAANSNCQLRVMNSDGAYTIVYGFSATASANNPGAWSLINSLATPRRAASMVSVGGHSASRGLYVLGGDDGTAANTMSSIEYAGVSGFDTVSNWRTLSQALPAGISFSGAVNIADYVYLVGGYDGTSAVKTVYQAHILSAEDVPVISDHYVLQNSANAGGVAAGLMYYRVASVYPVSYSKNPSGESLPSDAIQVIVPSVTGAEVTLKWQTDSAASGYNIYRSPTANSGDDTHLELLATVSGNTTTSFTDTGLSTTATAPKSLGDLGNWVTVTNVLNTAREGLAVTMSPDPSTANTYYLYAIGGRNTSGTALSSYEFASVTIDGSGAQTVGSWTTGANALAAARGDIKAWHLSNDTSDAVSAPDQWVYVGPGTSATNVDSFKVATGGDLSSPASENVVSGSFSGYSCYLSNNTLLLYGGQSGTASSSSRSTSIASTAPTLGTWNASTSLQTARIYAAGSETSSSMFVAGGVDGTPAVTATVEQAAK